MAEGYNFSEHLADLSDIADNLFDALLKVRQLADDAGDTGSPEWATASNINRLALPYNIRGAILNLVDITFRGADADDETLQQWRRDITEELNLDVVDNRKLRIIK